MDTYLIMRPDKTPVEIETSNIARYADRNFIFEPNKDPSLQWQNMSDEHVMVWQQMETQQSFDKLYGRIKGTLDPGTYTVYIANFTDISKFTGEKKFVLKIITDLGGDEQIFLGVVIFLMSIVVFCIMIALIVLECTIGARKKHYSLENLKW